MLWGRCSEAEKGQHRTYNSEAGRLLTGPGVRKLASLLSSHAIDKVPGLVVAGISWLQVKPFGTIGHLDLILPSRQPLHPPSGSLLEVFLYPLLKEDIHSLHSHQTTCPCFEPCQCWCYGLMVCTAIFPLPYTLFSQTFPWLDPSLIQGFPFKEAFPIIKSKKKTITLELPQNCPEHNLPCRKHIQTHLQGMISLYYYIQ